MPNPRANASRDEPVILMSLANFRQSPELRKAEVSSCAEIEIDP